MYLKGTVMQTGLQISQNRNQLADTSLLSEVHLYLEILQTNLHSMFHIGIRIYRL